MSSLRTTMMWWLMSSVCWGNRPTGKLMTYYPSFLLPLCPLMMMMRRIATTTDDGVQRDENKHYYDK